MCSDLFEQRNMYLDQILGERRSHRIFTPEYPPENEIRRILHAGLLAPFAAAAVGTSQDYFRRFFVMRRGSKAMATVTPLIGAAVQRMADGLEKEMALNPALREKAGLFARRLAMFRKAGVVPGVGTAP